MKKYILLLILFLALLLFGPPFRLFWSGYAYFISTPTDAPIDISQEPYLEDVPEGIEPIHVTTKHWDVLLEPRYRYTLAGKVLFSIDTREWSERFPFEAHGNEYMPIDLLIAWGCLARYDYAVTSYHRGDPFVGRLATIDIDYAKIAKKEKIEKEEITTFEELNLRLCEGISSDGWSHSHIIPASKSILTALKYSAQKGRDVKLEGYLVDIHQSRLDKPEVVYPDFITSTVIGDSACEFIYVDRIQIGFRLFQ